MNNSTISDRPSRETLLAKRYGLPPEAFTDLKAPWNDVLATLIDRHSARAFVDEPVSEQQLSAIVYAAQSAATSSNLQSWSVVAVEDAKSKARIAELSSHQRHVSQAPLLLVFIADLSRLRQLGEKAAAAVDGLEYFDSFVVSIIDASLAAQSAAVAANSLGLGTCFIGAMRNHPERIAEELSLPPESFAVFGLAIGKQDPRYDSDIKPRLPSKVVLHRGKYGSFDAAAISGYDQAMKTFEVSQRMPADAWTAKAIDRVSGPGALSGRDKLLAALKARGFGLK